MNNPNKTLWQLLWEYDPNGLIAVETDLTIRLVNPAFCKMLNLEPQDLIGKKASGFLDDADEFTMVWEKDLVIRAVEKEYPAYQLYVRKVMFPIRKEGIIAAIMVDLTHEWQQKNELQRLKQKTLEEVNQVVDRQMKVAQEIAGLLGETTAETKVSLLRVATMLRQDSV
ncbi:MAG: PAS domain-containing protein [Bacteroidetes bacterium]|nr:PAS domain-containing protein [Bacteroidota bacterium]